MQSNQRKRSFRKPSRGMSANNVYDDYDRPPIPKEPDGNIQLSGKISKVIYASKQDDYRIIDFASESFGDIIIVGQIGDIAEGMHINVSGTWKNHPKFGKQLEVKTFEQPKTKANLQLFITSGKHIKGVGPSNGLLLWEHFGESLIDVIRDEPHRLLEVPGIGKKTQESLIEWLKVDYANIDSLILLNNAGVHASIKKSLHKRFPGKVMEILKKNPYALLYEYNERITFKQLEKIARLVDFPMRSPERFAASIHETLIRASSDGHCFLTKKDLQQKTSKVLIGTVLTPAEFEQGFKILEETEKIINKNGMIWASHLYKHETNVALSLINIQKSAKLSVHVSVLDDVPQMKDNDGNLLKYDQSQSNAIYTSLANGVNVITGGPGTGKTMTIKTLISALSLPNMRDYACKGMLLCAPTGKAAQRLSEATGRQAKTIHRLLGCNPETGAFVHNKHNKLKDVGAIIVDEVSMVDISLMSSLLEAIPENCKLILVGDPNQLPSIGAGNLLRDIIDSDVIPVSTLTNVHRQRPQSRILSNAKAILEGNYNNLEWNENADDFEFVEANNAVSCQDSVIKYVKDMVQKDNIDIADIQIITPKHAGLAGTKNLNAVLQETLNPYGEVVSKSYGQNLKVGDKVIQTINDYDKLVFNGEMGEIIKSSIHELEYSDDDDLDDLDDTTSDKPFWVQFGDVIKKYEPNEANDLSLAYAITVHKSQGSEVRNIIQVVSSDDVFMLNRNLLYTGVTRAKEFCTLVGDEEAIQHAVKTTTGGKRNTMLAKRIQYYDSLEQKEQTKESGQTEKTEETYGTSLIFNI